MIRPWRNLLASGNALRRRFEYDPIYRLLSATGRECDQPPEIAPWEDQPRCTDLTKARPYTEQYDYDAMGNMLRLERRNEPGGFTREFTVETANNRLRRLQIGQSGYDYAFDASGNMLAEATSRHFEWNHSDKMKAFRTQSEGAEPSVHAHYLYDATGQRVKKLVRKQGGQVEVTQYVDGGFEHYRWGSGAEAGQNNRVHVVDDRQRIALVRLGAAHPEDRGPRRSSIWAITLAAVMLLLIQAAPWLTARNLLHMGKRVLGALRRSDIGLRGSNGMRKAD